ncbi:MAG: hypothetical protein JWO97_620 [Acidobacteria bacterium]|nr:hypothetical protein [Acidobacteriota bacterium]
MYSKTIRMATCAAVLVAASCGTFRSMAPWRSQPEHPEVNLAFTLEKNLVVMQSVSVDGRKGRFLFGSATQQTVLDPKLRIVEGSHALQLSTRDAIRFTPASADMHGIADGIIGADVWGSHAVSIDYFAGLVTYQKDGIYRELMNVYSFTSEPAVRLSVDGDTIDAIVDTTSPDTLTLPRGPHAAVRRKARITLAGADFGEVDVQYADVSAPRIGNRLLSHFLVSIDYGRRVVGLWRDPRFG